MASLPALGDRVASLTLVVTPAPDEEIPWYPEYSRPMLQAARADPAAALPEIVQQFGALMTDPDSLGASDPSAADAGTRALPGVLKAHIAMMREAAAKAARAQRSTWWLAAVATRCPSRRSTSDPALVRRRRRIHQGRARPVVSEPDRGIAARGDTGSGPPAARPSLARDPRRRVGLVTAGRLRGGRVFPNVPTPDLAESARAYHGATTNPSPMSREPAVWTKCDSAAD